MDAFANRLMVLAKDCNFADVTAVEYKREWVLQCFVLDWRINIILLWAMKMEMGKSLRTKVE